MTKEEKVTEEMVLEFIERISKLAKNVYLAIWGDTGAGWEEITVEDFKQLIKASEILLAFIKKYDPEMYETESKYLFLEYLE